MWSPRLIKIEASTENPNELTKWWWFPKFKGLSHGHVSEVLRGSACSFIWKTYACRCRLTVMNENFRWVGGNVIPLTVAAVPFWLKSQMVQQHVRKSKIFLRCCTANGLASCLGRITCLRHGDQSPYLFQSCRRTLDSFRSTGWQCWRGPSPFSSFESPGGAGWHECGTTTRWFSPIPITGHSGGIGMAACKESHGPPRWD